ncbi:MAG: FAD-binding oxidoreductase, partial [Pyrinomonadaceae bacterium]
LLPKPEGVMSGVVFFRHEEPLLAFVSDARERSLKTRVAAINSSNKIDARALEYLDRNSLRMLRHKYTSVPEDAAGAVFFEQETDEQTEDALMSAWLELLEKHDAPLEDAWFATNESDRLKISEFRHHLPVMVNEWLTRTGMRKISTDMAVPDGVFPEVLRFYRETLTASGVDFIIFGHIGDNHVHVNILPKNEAETSKAREIYLSFVSRIIKVGGTVSAEHGIGKLKVDYLRALFGDEHIRQMAALKRAFDPACILGRGNMFSAEFLEA